MSHANATKPESDEACRHTHQHLVCESLTVKAPKAKGSVSIMATPQATGIWVQTGNGQECVGLVAQEGAGPYLVIYDKEPKGLPLAVCQDHIQLPCELSVSVPLVISFEDLLKAVRHVCAAPPLA